MTCFEATNSVFNVNLENNSFSISATGLWTSEDGEELINKLIKFLERRSENDIGLHDKEVERRSTRTEIENCAYNIACFDHFKSEILSELKRVKYRDLEDMVYRLQLTYDEIVDILDVKFIAESTIRYTLPPRIYEICDFNLIR